MLTDQEKRAAEYYYKAKDEVERLHKSLREMPSWKFFLMPWRTLWIFSKLRSAHIVELGRFKAGMRIFGVQRWIKILADLEDRSEDELV